MRRVSYPLVGRVRARAFNAEAQKSKERTLKGNCRNSLFCVLCVLCASALKTLLGRLRSDDAQPLPRADRLLRVDAVPAQQIDDAYAERASDLPQRVAVAHSIATVARGRR